MRIMVFFLLTLIVVGAACSRENNETVMACTQSTQVPVGYVEPDFAEIEYDQNHCGYLPLGKRNYWVYLDSVFNGSGQFQSEVLDTIRFIKTSRTPDGIVWWSLKGTIGYLTNLVGYPAYNYSTDSIAYGTAFSWGSRAGLKWFYSINSAASATEIIPYSDASSLCYAEKLLTPVLVPAGNFTGCMFFRKNTVYATALDFHTWYKPGLGILKTDVYLGVTRIRSSILLSYYIE